jgi:hypothetical protein
LFWIVGRTTGFGAGLGVVVDGFGAAAEACDVGRGAVEVDRGPGDDDARG